MGRLGGTRSTLACRGFTEAKMLLLGHASTVLASGTISTVSSHTTAKAMVCSSLGPKAGITASTCDLKLSLSRGISIHFQTGELGLLKGFDRLRAHLKD